MDYTYNRQEKTEYLGVRKLWSSDSTIEPIYEVKKIVKGKKMSCRKKTLREALKAVDMFLIREGKSPKYVLKRI